MKKVIIAVMVVFTFALVAFAAAGPETVDLQKAWNVAAPTKKAVVFPHRFHQSKNQCTECHMTAAGGALKSVKTGAAFNPKGNVKGMNNVAHSEFCWECHTKKNVPQGKSCAKCHK